MSKFKVGDKVRILSYPEDYFEPGTEAEVRGYNGHFVKTSPVWGVGASLFEENELELIEPEVPELWEEENVVNHPHYYTKGFSNGAEVIDIVENLPYNAGAAVKYLARAGKKDATKEIEDLLKARWYVNRQLSKLGYTEEEN